MSFLLASIALSIIWLALMFFSPQTRREQFTMSLVGLFLSPGALLVALQHFAIESAGLVLLVRLDNFLFSFSLFGIAAVIYQIIFSKRMTTTKKSNKKLKKNHDHWGIRLLLLAAIWLLVAEISIALGADTLLSFVIGGVIIGVYMIADRHELLVNAIVSGLVIAILVFLVEQIFVIHVFPGSLVYNGVPVLEILWAAVIGFATGPLYEYARRFSLK